MSDPFSGWKPDPGVEWWVSRLIDLIGKAEWVRRRSGIEQFLAEIRPTTHEERFTSASHVPEADMAAWHLYLCETYTNDPARYDVAQGARVIPVVKAFHQCGDRLFGIPGVVDRLRAAFLRQPAQFEHALFELLVAATYMRNGWSNVHFLAEGSSTPQPDLAAECEDGALFVECKRKSRLSKYAREERNHWMRLYLPVARRITEQSLPVLLDIVFRVPVVGLPGDFLIRQLEAWLRDPRLGVIIDDTALWVEARQVRLDRVQTDLREYSVRYDTPRLPYLLFEHSDPTRGFHYTVAGSPDPRLPNAFTSVKWAAGAIWSCEAEDSYRATARYLQRELAEGIRQLPASAPAAFHWGMDVYDGEQVSRRVLERTLQALANFTPGNRDLRWIYCHLFEFQVPPNETWAVNETCHCFGRADAVDAYSLHDPRTITFARSD